MLHTDLDIHRKGFDFTQYNNIPSVKNNKINIQSNKFNKSTNWYDFIRPGNEAIAPKPRQIITSYELENYMKGVMDEREKSKFMIRVMRTQIKIKDEEGYVLGETKAFIDVLQMDAKHQLDALEILIARPQNSLSIEELEIIKILQNKLKNVSTKTKTFNIQQQQNNIYEDPNTDTTSPFFNTIYPTPKLPAPPTIKVLPIPSNQPTQLILDEFEDGKPIDESIKNLILTMMWNKRRIKQIQDIKVGEYVIFIAPENVGAIFSSMVNKLYIQKLIDVKPKTKDLLAQYTTKHGIIEPIMVYNKAKYPMMKYTANNFKDMDDLLYEELPSPQPNNPKNYKEEL